MKFSMKKFLEYWEKVGQEPVGHQIWAMGLDGREVKRDGKYYACFDDNGAKMMFAKEWCE